MQCQGRVSAIEHAMPSAGESPHSVALPRAAAELERRLAQQAAIADLGLRITEGLSGVELQTLAAELLRQGMDADLTGVLEIAAGRETAVLRAGSGWPEGRVGVLELQLGPDRLTGQVLRAGEPLLVDDLGSAPMLIEQGMTSGVAAPVGSRHEPSGVLGAFSRSAQRFGPDDVAFLQALASLLAGADVRDRAAAEAEEAQARFRSAFRHAPIGMALFDADPRPGEPILWQVNDAMCAMLGYDSAELLAIDPVALSHPDDLGLGLDDARALAAGTTPSYSVEKRLLRADGSVMHARIRASIVRGSAGTADYGVCQIEDVTEARRLAEEESRIWELSVDLLAIIGPEGFVRVSPSWERRLGWTAAELIALPFEELIHHEDQELASESFARAVRTPDRETHFEARVRTRRGDWRWLAWSGRCAEREAPGEPVRVYCVARDITDRRDTERALVESLSLFDQSFENAPIGMAIAEPGTGRYLRVNDALCRLLGRTEDDLLARASLLEIADARDEDGAGVAPSAIPGDGTFQAETRHLLPGGTHLWTSLHVTPIRDADGHVSALFGQIIDATAQKARQEELQRKLDEVGWASRIRAALEFDRFELHSQPIVDLQTGAVVQRELLIRMRGENGELVPPNLFLPAAEEQGLIEDIDRWVLRHAVAIAAGGDAVEVNVSAASMSSAAFLTAVERELDASGADPARLVFEITETALMRQLDLGVAFAERLTSLGCRFALDDFGTGYGGFTYLKHLPVHYLKIDREFVRDLAGSPRDRHVVEAIVKLAGAFEAQTIAEGVEDQETLELLRSYGVDYAQGFHLGRPAPVGQGAA
jgi:PAS domain S-box-containing protein